MTAEPDLLPELVAEGLDFFNLAGDEGDKLYVSAIRQHIAAKDAEIAALRAEVERSERYAEQSERERLWAEARAERLAEALRPHIEDLEQSAVVLDQYPAMAPTAAEMRKAAAELRAALDPTAAQEAGRE